ncbi:MAG: hypothetical protein IKZ07_06185 [Akkermansia sp.]|nr:hypothetical protein [Akkermansia sp.]
MGNNAIKSIIILSLLSALAFIAGSMASEGIQQAVVPIVLVVGTVVLLGLGRHSWALVYVIPALLLILDLPLARNLPLIYVVSVPLFLYWFLLYTLGYVKFTWHSVPSMDVSVLLLCGYFMLTWCWNPVTLNVFVDRITDTGDQIVGGNEYVWCLFAVIFYIFISVVPQKLETLGKLLKVVFWGMLVLQVGLTLRNLVFGGAEAGVASEEMTSMSESISSSRFGGFVVLGMIVANFIACKYSFTALMSSPLRLGTYMLALLGVALSGFRNFLLSVALTMMFAQYYHRRMVMLILMGCVAYGGVLLISSTGVIKDLPYGVKRVLSSVPGVELNERAAIEAEESLTWRYEMWGWALDPKTGYIKDYVWGDGYGVSIRRQALKTRAVLRGTHQETNRDYAEAGLWHSGWITAIHRTGIVGLALVILLQVVTLVHGLRVCAYLVNVKNSAYIFYYVVPTFSSFIIFHASAGIYKDVFQAFTGIALVKVLTSVAIREGLMEPLFARKVYVPLMQRELEPAAKSAG